MVSSARNPNESYAERARKASTSSSTLNTLQNYQQQTVHAPNTQPSSSLKPPPVNVWAERIKEQQAHATSQPTHMPRQRASSSPQPPRDDAIHPRSPPPDLSAQLAILDQQDEHDPFVVRVPPHLSRRSSSSTNPLPAADPNTWPLPGAEPHSNASPTGYDSVAPSRQSSTASVRHHAYSPSGSVHLSRVQSSFSQHSRSASQSRAQSRSGSSSSSPRLQIRGRALPQDDSPPPDLSLDQQPQRSSNTRSSPALLDPPNHISTSFPIDLSPIADPSYYRRPPIPPLQDMSHYAHNYVPQYALPPPFPLTHVPGHTSPSYITTPRSGQATPPYTHYPPYPAYMYEHPPFFWGEIPPHSQNHLQNQPSILSNHTSASEHNILHKIEFGTVSPSITTESEASKNPENSQNSSQPRPSRSVVFGTINPTEPQHNPSPPPPNEEQRADTTVEHATEQFATFSIGVGPDEPGPSRHASRKPSVKSLSRNLASQPTNNENTKDAHTATPPSREANGVIKTPIKWEFGTTHSADLDDPQPSSPPTQTPVALSDPQIEPADDQPESCNPLLSQETSQADRSVDMSETTSTASDVWVVKDYGYGFGDHGVRRNAPEVVRWEVREREKERAREGHRDREMLRDRYHDRGWVAMRQSGWRHENGIEEGRGSWEQQQLHVDAPRHVRQRRGSFNGFGGHERGGHTPRRGRGFSGRVHGGRGRGGFFHHQRPGSYPYVHPPAPPPPPSEVLPRVVDMVNGYGHYASSELESYDALPASHTRLPLLPATHSIDATRDYLLQQLEYYLSPQNMAQDLFLRQRMDGEGWIPISLLASFKRVQQLHTDTDIVREVLSRSTVVEVNGDWVRMGGRQWELFVLPNAPRSVVSGAARTDGENTGFGPHQVAEFGENDGEHGETEGDCDVEDCEGDDEDDDIVFVIGEEAEGSWMTVPERKQ